MVSGEAGVGGEAARGVGVVAGEEGGGVGGGEVGVRAEGDLTRFSACGEEESACSGYVLFGDCCAGCTGRGGDSSGGGIPAPG